MGRTRVALIGCGGRGRGHLRALLDFPDIEVVALCDPDPGTLKDTGEIGRAHV